MVLQNQNHNPTPLHERDEIWDEKIAGREVMIMMMLMTMTMMMITIAILDE